MAKHRRRDQESSVNNENNNTNRNMMNSNNNPFGIDPMQLLGLLGGNFDMRNMNNMLASMNTNGFNLNNLGPLAQMAGLNLDNNFPNSNSNNNLNKNNNSNSVSQNMSTNNMIRKNDPNIQKNDITADKRNNINTSNNKNIKNNDKNNTVDENLEFLIALRSFVHQSKVPFVDRIIDGYKKGLIK
ncbi:hypothetical protein [uncultured Clostridium sp.]|uniref:hypothetical protein n=1 Tax=uncultured Clostridium sp. TaxID=59620 RepID=UPI0025EC3E2B|nr:hypothetical protein [uncultured Clostridium sp.]